MATSSAILSVAGGVHFGACGLQSNKLKSLIGHQSQLSMHRSSKQPNKLQKLSVQAEYGDGSRGGGGDFLAGFLLGGALFGTLAYVFAPQIRRSILNEDESGFRRAKRPIYYYDDGLEKTRQTLNAKISQLNSAIDNVSSRLRGGNNNTPAPELIETDPEVEATL
ncbi:uncharacterized protein LOC110025250 isoform X2 [Phalaenopsis equestris]|uniref:uncharacterized protein LOC110025250 isoform X2 n=1 Tax=Phalaenopsis equestris TaxID=78828 RepID=UPI0009E28E06|nr:uncharacterized protein LOC110025250 isoform X2 [Phalaenopsis equestris]